MTSSACIFPIFPAFFFTLFTFMIVPFVNAQTPVKLLFVVESTDTSIKGLLNDFLPTTEKEFGGGNINLDAAIVEVDRDNIEGSHQKVCAALYDGVTLILDMTWTGWDKLRKLATDNSIIYKRTDSTIIPYVQAVDDLLAKKNATDVALIFENERDLNQSLYYLIGNSIIRLVVIDELTETTVAKVRAMRPSPSYYAIYANTSKMETLFKTALDGGLVKRNGIWNLVFTDNNYKNFKYISGNGNLNVTLGVLSMRTDVCCRMIDEMPCNCPTDFQIFPHYFKRLLGLLVGTIAEVIKSGVSVETKSAQCDAKNSTSGLSNATIDAFNANLVTTITAQNDVFETTSDMIYYKAEIELETLQDGNLEKLGNWSRRTGIQVAEGKEILPAKRYFRVGTTEAIPWTSIKRDSEGRPMKDAEGNEIWEGYCIDFIQKLSEEMNFEYDLVIPTDRSFGNKLPNGKWTGLVGDLARGETDIALAALTMTSEREEVIDFVAPYFAQSGILIGSINKLV
nr:ionotropic receptor 3 [Gregopimpla kuwanae]